MKSVYIASPYTKPEGKQLENVNKSFDIANTLIDIGYAPFCPLYSHFLHERQEHRYDFWMKLDFYWLRKCDCVLRLPGESHGADLEVQLANRLGIPVYYGLQEFLKGEGVE